MVHVSHDSHDGWPWNAIEAAASISRRWNKICAANSGGDVNTEINTDKACIEDSEQDERCEKTENRKQTTPELCTAAASYCK